MRKGAYGFERGGIPYVGHRCVKVDLQPDRAAAVVAEQLLCRQKVRRVFPYLDRDKDTAPDRRAVQTLRALFFRARIRARRRAKGQASHLRLHTVPVGGNAPQMDVRIHKSRRNDRAGGVKNRLRALPLRTDMLHKTGFLVYKHIGVRKALPVPKFSVFNTK